MEQAWGDLCRRGSRCHLSLPPEAAGTPTPRLAVLPAVSFPATHALSFHQILLFESILRSHDPKPGTHSVTHLFNHLVIHSGP